MCSNSPETDALVLASELAMRAVGAQLWRKWCAQWLMRVQVSGGNLVIPISLFDPFGFLFDTNNIFLILDPPHGKQVPSPKRVSEHSSGIP